ncbi:MAG: hypothetical protein A2984_02715 [Omnitrophica WOR_2 bacterium RIFCSPLOWO2_01_FULL_41_12]|nr:MAG: hypothetical protein A2984_02715 [Omnitrophica WOR_2 bacterium RIFCSPLOWO2_01_FULL_41_12]
MNLKKNLKTRRAQSIVEYILVFTVIAAGIIVVLGGFMPENLTIKTAFDQAVNNAIGEINKP